MKRYAVIVAGGKGTRMKSSLPKQFLQLKGKPILMRTLEVFYAFDATVELILVLPKEQQIYWRKLCEEYSFLIPHSVADGGESRFHSVSNGLKKIKGDGIVAIHDGVRPFVSTAVLKLCYLTAEKYDAVIPVIDIQESLRKVEEEEKTIMVDRSKYVIVQTPQVFKVKTIKSAYEQPYSSLFTDDASVVEAYGGKIHTVRGNEENIKLTTPFHLKIAEVLL
ncbi:MAG: 2-C-methyl-D-erythritol 4-phosphate cytidylyltransferase [Bacteroidales bacterium]|nr:2-C-methyl-D-erythritol 4-phosphate cytidylyltransferase [Bacteroidales bacterium]